MGSVGEFFAWLFGSRQGVIWLVAGAVVVFGVVAFILESRTRKTYFNHEKTEDDWDFLADDAESGWSDFDDDNK
ncbi:MAG: hypothetical protein IJH87_04815 [Atopobiaceae bacterium]|nr:hypothetical protein [Atopobiaceae bacterium]